MCGGASLELSEVFRELSNFPVSTTSVVIIGLGTDLVEVSRIRESIVSFGDRFLRRVFTEGEQAYASLGVNSVERYAARFAAKEAGMKALGTGWSRGVRWTDFEIVRADSGRPTLQLHGTAADIARSMNVKQISVSLTHTATIASAIVILE